MKIYQKFRTEIDIFTKHFLTTKTTFREVLNLQNFLLYFIAFYSVMGTLSHSKIILELLLQNDNTDLLLVIK